MLYTARSDEQLTGAENHVSVVHPDRQLAANDQEELIGVFVGVPHEFALDLHDLDLVVVEPCHHLGRPVLRDQRELVGKINGTTTRVLMHDVPPRRPWAEVGWAHR